MPLQNLHQQKGRGVRRMMAFPTRNRKEETLLLAQKCRVSSITMLAFLLRLPCPIHEYVLLYRTYPKFPPVISSVIYRPRFPPNIMCLYFRKGAVSTYCLQYMCGYRTIYWSISNFSQATSISKTDFLPPAAIKCQYFLR
jgi:hypothetical protein